MKQAKEDLVRAVDKNPDDVDALIALADYVRRERNPADAIEIYNRVLALDLENALAFLGKGLCWGMALLETIPPASIWDREYDEEEMFENALEFLEQASELDPELTEVLNAIARLYIIIDREDEAIEMFKQSLVIDQTQLDVLEYLSDLKKVPIWKLLDKGTWMGEADEE